MSRNRRWHLVSVFAIIAPFVARTGVAAAQSPGPAQPATMRVTYVDAARGRSVEELVTLAMERSPDVQAARLRADVARSDQAQAGGRPNPAVPFARRDQIRGADHQTSIGFTMPLDLFVRSGRLAVDSRDVESASAAADDRARVVALNVRVLAARLLADVHHLDVQQAVSAAIAQSASLIAERVGQGTSPAIDRDAARIEAQMAEVRVRRQRAETDAAAAALRNAIGLTPDEPLVLRESLEDMARAGLVASAAGDTPISSALDTRPDLRQANAAIAREAGREDLLEREARPEIGLTASYMRMASSFPQFGLTPSGVPTPIAGTFDTISIGATVTLPWGQRNRGAIAAAGFARQAAVRDYNALKIRVLNEIDALRTREAQARSALRLFDDDMQALASHNVDVVRESYQLGRATLIDVLAETRRLLDVEAAYGDALLDFVEARVQLAAALGER